MGNYKKLGWTEADVLCPFYLEDERKGRSIRCEGYAGGVDTVSRFKSLALMDRHVGCYCAGKFERCPVYRCTYSSKYAEA